MADLLRQIEILRSAADTARWTQVQNYLRLQM